MVTVEFKLLSQPEEIEEIENVEAAIWGRDETVPCHQLLAASRNGGLIIGVYDRRENADKPDLIGFSYAFPGKDQEKTWLYSHMTGFLPQYRGQNLGFKLKCFQRELALQRKYNLITWTYDPLFAANGRLNIGKLGGIVRKYNCDYYGKLRDPMNAGLPSDRCIVEWYISSERVSRILDGGTEVGRLKDVQQLPSILPVSFSSSQAESLPVPGEPVLNATDRQLVLAFPKDFQSIKLKDADLALSWRLVTRQIFLHYLSNGYVLTQAWSGEDLAYYVFEKDFSM